MIGFYKINGFNSSRVAFKRTHVASATIFNGALLAENAIYFDKGIFVWDDLDLNVRANAAGLVIVKSYRQALFKVDMPEPELKLKPEPEPELEPELEPEPEPVPVLPRPLSALLEPEVRTAPCARPRGSRVRNRGSHSFPPSIAAANSLLS